MSEYLNYSQDIITRVDEYDFREHLKPSAVMQYFQDVATTHAEILGIGFADMKAQNLCWVISRMSARMLSLPRVGDRIKVVTYPRKPGLVEAIRDYYIYGANGELLVKGTSKWCVLDYEKRVIRRCSPLFSFAESEYKPDDVFEDGNLQLDELKEYDSVKKGVVQITDLDRNIHMNNARYGDMIYNAMDLDFLKNHTVSSFDVNYLMELRAGQDYEIRFNTKNLTSVYETVRDNKTVFRAKLTWNRNE